MNSPEKEEIATSTNPYAAPVIESVEIVPQMNSSEQGDGTGGLIPYKNPHALLAYYLGIVALFPLIGVPFGIASIILGISGLRKRRENPAIKGSVHAIIGIVFGCFALICGGLVAMVVGSALFANANQQQVMIH